METFFIFRRRERRAGATVLSLADFSLVNGNWWLGIAERDGLELGTNPFDFAQDKLAFVRFIILLASRNNIIGPV